jgi:hypothetical protein
MWTFEYIETDDEANVTTQVALDTVIPQLTVYETVGDERLHEAGDLSISTRQPLEFSSAAKHKWIALYWNGTLHNVYSVPKTFEKFNYITKLYEHRCRSLQAIFYDHLKNTRVSYNVSAEYWNDGLSFANVVIDQIRRDNGTGPDYEENAWGWSLGDMLTNMAGSGRHNYYGYEFTSIEHPFPGKFEVGEIIPLLFRGLSVSGADTELNAVTHTFSDHDVFWMDIFKLALYTSNSYLQVRPHITADILGIDVEIISKSTDDRSGATAISWIEYETEREKYRLDGMKLEGGNFTFTLNDSEGAYAFNKSIIVSDPEMNIAEDGLEILFWAAGSYDSGIGQHIILNVSDQNEAYHEAEAIEGFYSNFFLRNDGANGRIRFDGEKLMDKVKFGDAIVQITKLTIDQDGIAELEGIDISFDPLDVDTVGLWEGDGYITTPGGDVESWIDKSDVSIEAAQATGADQPQHDLAGKYVIFNSVGTTEHLAADPSDAGELQPSIFDFSIEFYAEFDGLLVTTGIISKGEVGAANKTWLIRQVNDNISVLIGDGSGVYWVNEVMDIPAANTKYLFSIVLDRDGDQLGYRNAVEQFSQSVANAISITNAEEFLIGKDQGDVYHEGKIYEIRISKKARTPDEITEYLAYLQNKYGV